MFRTKMPHLLSIAALLSACLAIDPATLAKIQEQSQPRAGDPTPNPGPTAAPTAAPTLPPIGGNPTPRPSQTPYSVLQNHVRLKFNRVNTELCTTAYYSMSLNRETTNPSEADIGFYYTGGGGLISDMTLGIMGVGNSAGKLVQFSLRTDDSSWKSMREAPLTGYSYDKKEQNVTKKGAVAVLDRGYIEISNSDGTKNYAKFLVTYTPMTFPDDPSEVVFDFAYQTAPNVRNWDR